MSMKKHAKAAAAGLLAAVTLLGSCGKTAYSGKKGMQQYARDFYENDKMEIAGTNYDRDETLAWFVYTNGTYKRCEATTFRKTSDGKYTAENNELVLKEADGVWLCMWHRGLAIHIENTDCRKVSVSDADSTVSFDITNAPYTLFYPCPGRTGETTVYCYDKNDRKII